MVGNGCEDDGNNSFDAFVLALRLDTGSMNQPVLFLEPFAFAGFFGVVAFVLAAR